MKKSITMKRLLAAAAVIALFGGTAIYNKGLILLSFAAEDEHGHPHGHEDGADDHGVEEKDDGHDDGHDEEGGGHDHGEESHEEGKLTLSSEQMATSGITTVPVRQGILSHQVIVPGRIVADADRMAQIVPKVSGIVVESRKNIGDFVTKGEVLALIESREMAEATAEYEAAGRSADLAKTTYQREKTLWEKKITAQQDYLGAKNIWQDAQIKLDLAKQKIEALGGTNTQGTPSRYHALKSPMGGQVIERELVLGEFVDTSHKAFTVADLSVLWVETAIAPADIPAVREGQDVLIEGNGKQGTGKLIFISPVINPDTRAAKAIVELENADGLWRSGDYANATIVTGTQQGGLIVPKEAVQQIEGKSVVFVKTPGGFEKRNIIAGKTAGNQVEIRSGLKAGEEVGVGNSFILKAEAGKSEAEHSH